MRAWTCRCSSTISRRRCRRASDRRKSDPWRYSAKGRFVIPYPQLRLLQPQQCDDYAIAASHNRDQPRLHMPVGRVVGVGEVGVRAGRWRRVRPIRRHLVALALADPLARLVGAGIRVRPLALALADPLALGPGAALAPALAGPLARLVAAGIRVRPLAL